MSELERNRRTAGRAERREALPAQERALLLPENLPAEAQRTAVWEAAALPGPAEAVPEERPVTVEVLILPGGAEAAGGWLW